MTEAERLVRAKAGQDAWVQKARDYGELRNMGVNLGAQQIEDLKALGEWPPVSEHIRRAVDAYLKEHLR